MFPEKGERLKGAIKRGKRMVSLNLLGEDYSGKEDPSEGISPCGAEREGETWTLNNMKTTETKRDGRNFWEST